MSQKSYCHRNRRSAGANRAAAIVKLLPDTKLPAMGQDLTMTRCRRWLLNGKVSMALRAGNWNWFKAAIK